MPDSLSINDLDLWRTETTPAWRVFLPLGIVMLSLVALVVVPPLFTSYATSLRQELSDVLNPLTSAVGTLERITGNELAAARGFAATGDPYFADQFLAAHEYGNTVAARVDSLGAYVSEPIRVQINQMVEMRTVWAQTNFGRTRVDFVDNLAEQQAYFDATMGAVQTVRESLAQEIELLLDRVARSERGRNTLTIILGLIALIAAGAAISLAQRLRNSERHILRRARQEGALRRIAQSIAEAEDLPGALGRIVGAVAHIARAERVYIQHVDLPANEVEVIASLGVGAPPIGKKEPYAGSSVELVLRAAVEESPQDEQQEDFGTQLVVPLVSEGELLGAMTLERQEGGQVFDLPEARRTRLLADMAALVFHHLHLVEEIRQKEADLQKTAKELQILNETLEQRVKDRTRTIRELSSALTLAEQSERSELAQFIHDDLQQILFGLQLNLKVLETNVPNLTTEQVLDQLRAVRDGADTAIHSARRLTMDLSPPVDEEERFIEALNWLARHSKERFELNVEIKSEDELRVASGDVRILVFRIIRELLFNVVKHARTKNVQVEASRQNGHLVLEVIDDGIGFDSSAVRQQSTIGGFGLRRASERLELLGGNIQINSEKGKGTRSRISVPVEG